MIFVNNNRPICPNLGFFKQLKIFEQKLKEVNYDIDEVDLSDVTWPPPEGISYDDI